ncbi:ATP-binding protein [uncultured Desulfobacter sp.]|uniref:ATP-binding protein n=1 Tax=uncultured Desulfobacter sp. TaxID=240139 RepID=UPI0029F5078C|nr:ATP-binding protein [uncultured Desulfobacter sp.]
MFRTITGKISAIVFLLILLFVVNYGLLTYFLKEQEILATQMLEMSQAERRLHALNGRFYEDRFWEKEVLEEKNPNAIANYGASISNLKKELKALENIKTNKSIQAKLHAIRVEILEHEKVFNEAQQLKTTQNIHRTTLNTSYRSLISNVLNNDMRQLFKPLFNLNHFFIVYIMQQDEPVYHSLMMVIDYLNKKIEQIDPSDHRTEEYLLGFKHLLAQDYKLAIVINDTEKSFELAHNSLFKQFDSVFIQASALFKNKYLEAEFKRNNLNNMALVLTIVSVTLLGVVFYLFSKTIVTPIRYLAMVMRKVKEGNFDERFSWPGNKKDELIRYGYHFNTMLDTLQENETLLRTLIEVIPDLIWLKSPQGEYLLCNLRFERFFGAKQKDILGKTDYDFLDKKLADFFREKDQAAIRANKPCLNEEDIVYADDGHKEHLETIKTPVFDADGNLKGVLGIARDITERKKNEDEKIEAYLALEEHKKLALVGKIAGKMSHDFNNILGIIMGQSEVGLFKCQEEETLKIFKRIFDQSLRGKNLTKNLVAFAKDQEPKYEYFHLNEKIELVLSLLQKDLDGIEIRKKGLSEPMDFFADPGMIEHCLVNIFQNSIHALSKCENPFIFIQLRQSKAFVIITIEDNGCGIPEKHIDNIFEPSFTLKGSKDVISSYDSSIKGSGYGMANVNKYVALHKGKINVRSQLNNGTTVELHFPIIRKKLTKEEKITIQNEGYHTHKRILLVEDEIQIAEVQRFVLTTEPCNHIVDVAHTAEAALNFFDDNDYDLISLDFILPGKINGKQIYDHIRSTNKTIPILFISGNIEFLESIKDLKRNDLLIDHVSKPCQNITYLNSIKLLLDKANG